MKLCKVSMGCIGQMTRGQSSPLLANLAGLIAWEGFSLDNCNCVVQTNCAGGEQRWDPQHMPGRRWLALLAGPWTHAPTINVQ